MKMNLVNTFLAQLTRGYQLYISPLIGGSSCRYYPTCSEYTLWLLQQNVSLIWVVLLALYRLARCHPFSKGGIHYPIIWRLHQVRHTLKPPTNQIIPLSFWLIKKTHICFGIRFEFFYLIKIKQEGCLRV